MTIQSIDFHTDKYRVRIGEGVFLIWKRGGYEEKPIEFKATEISRMLRVASEQLDDPINNYEV
ncbi:hypothetical protein DJ031_06850 [bacterium endosymbiont of Escarpia laminata]|nr:MAG: hypothetical protein DJ031_06850 [bacterium endosymbiont of Escarpia laminata]